VAWRLSTTVPADADQAIVLSTQQHTSQHQSALSCCINQPATTPSTAAVLHVVVKDNSRLQAGKALWLSLGVQFLVLQFAIHKYNGQDTEL
jgi:hypothetical protein